MSAHLNKELSQKYHVKIRILGLRDLKSLGMAMYDVHVCLPQWTVLGCILLLPFVVTARSMGSYQSLIWFNILTIIGTVGIPLWVMAARTEDGVSDRGAYYAVAPISLSSSMAGLSKIAFAFSSQFMVTEIISEMKDPADRKSVV